MSDDVGYRNLLLIALTVQAKAVAGYLNHNGEYTSVPSKELDLLGQIIKRLGEMAPKRKA